MSTNGPLNTGLARVKAQAKASTPKARKAVVSRSVSELKELELAESRLPPASPDDLVMRSVNLLKSQDDRLRQLAFDRRVSKNELIRAAIASKLNEWSDGTGPAFYSDLEMGNIGFRD